MSVRDQELVKNLKLWGISESPPRCQGCWIQYRFASGWWEQMAKPTKNDCYWKMSYDAKAFCHRLVVCCQSDRSFLNPSRSITSEKQARQIRCTENCSTCSQHWWAEWPVLHTTTRRHHLTSSFSQVGRIGLWSYASSTTFTWPLANHPPLQGSRSCLQGKCFHNQQDAENAFQEFVESWSTDFYAMGINKHFSLAKNVLTVMVLILINKDVF